jgi:hypothetical protein
MRSWLCVRVLMVGVTLVLAGCGDEDDGGGNGGGSCDSIAGRWVIGGQCGPDLCAITQNGCATTLDCSGGAASYTGSVSGSSLSYSGTAASGAPGTCTGTVSGNTITGSCASAGVTCTYNATRQ